MFDTLYSQIREADRGIFVQGDPLNMCTLLKPIISILLQRYTLTLSAG